METYDFVSIGGGPAGYAAGIYAARFNMKTLILTKERGGLITTTHIVENYPGFPSISGFDLMQEMEKHVNSYDVKIEDDTVTSVEKQNDLYLIKTERGNEYLAKTVMFATGTKHRKLNAPGEKELYGRGVSYCATCDGPLYKKKVIGIVGGSDSAAKEALLLSEYGEKVYIIYRKEKIRPEPINYKRVMEKSNIEIINNANVTEICGEGKLTHVVLDREFNGSNQVKLDGLFIDIGLLPQTELAKSLGIALNEKGEIIVDRVSKTNLPGVFAAGDCADMPWKQAITAAAEGAIAAWSAYEFLGKEGRL